MKRNVRASAGIAGAGVVVSWIVLALNVAAAPGQTLRGGLVPALLSSRPVVPGALVDMDAPLLNNLGLIAVRTSYAPGTFRYAVNAGLPGSVNIVVRAGDQAPDEPPGSPLAEPTNLRLNDRGEIFFRSPVSVAATLAEGVWGGAPGAIGKIAVANEIVAGTATNRWTFSATDIASMAWSDNGAAAMLINISGFAGPGVYSVRPGAPALPPAVIARPNDTVSGVLEPTRWRNIYSGVLATNGLGEAMFAAGMAPTVGAPYNALVRAVPGNATVLATSAQVIDGLPATARLNLDAPIRKGLNDRGDAAFAASYTNPGASGVGLFTSRRGESVRAIAKSGDTAPSLEPGASLLMTPTDPSSVRVNARGDALFSTGLQGAGITSANNEAMWLNPAGGTDLLPVWRKGAEIPGTGGAVGQSIVGTATTVECNALRQAVMMVMLAGPGVTPANNRGLYAFDPATGPQLLLRTGDTVPIAPGDLRIISEIWFGSSPFEPTPPIGSGVEDGRVRALNDLGNAAVRLRFSDGTVGAFVVTVPAPSSLVSVGVAAVVVGRRRRTR